MQDEITVLRLIIVTSEGWKSSNIWEQPNEENSIQEEVKSRLKSGNACYYSVQNLLSPRLLSKNLKIGFAHTTVWAELMHGHLLSRSIITQ
jgi:hypothetical protein